MVESIVDGRFWIGGILLAFQVGLFVATEMRTRRIARSDRDPTMVRQEQLRLVFGVAALAFLNGSVIGAVVLLTLMEMDGAGLLPGILPGIVIGAALAAWNPWLRRFDASEDESGLAMAVQTAAIANYPSWLPFALAIPAVSVVAYLMLTLDRDAATIVAMVFAALGAAVTVTLFCLSAISIAVLFRLARET